MEVREELKEIMERARAHTSFAWQDLLGFAAILVMAVLIALPERASEKSTEKAEN